MSGLLDLHTRAPMPHDTASKTGQNMRPPAVKPAHFGARKHSSVTSSLARAAMLSRRALRLTRTCESHQCHTLRQTRKPGATRPSDVHQRGGST